MTARVDAAGVTRRARREGRRAGRADGLGYPLAERLELLPGRRWIKERYDEFIGEAERQLVVRRRALSEELEVQRERQRELDDELARETALIAELEPLRAEDGTRPRHQQNLSLEYKLAGARERLDATTRSRREVAQRLCRIAEQLAEVDHEFTAWPARLHEGRDCAEHEHDIAYRRAQHGCWLAVARRMLGLLGVRAATKRAEA